MKLIRFGSVHAEAPGALTSRGIVPLGPILARYGLAHDLRAVLALWDRIGHEISAAVASSSATIDPATVRLGAPIPRGANILAVGKNYPSADGTRPDVDPVLFVKSGTALTGPNDEIVLPSETDAVDYEVELAIVIGEGGRHIREADATRHIAGYTIANDVTAAGLMFPGHLDDPAALSAFRLQTLKGKSLATFLPIGPCIVTTDEFGAIGEQVIATSVNGEERQRGSLGSMLHGVNAIVAELSRYVELSPGDVILTGTPPGVGWEASPPRWLRDGDVVRMSIDGIGEMVHTVRADRAEAAA
ncbi:MAG TPA: fumarylacetoacetate hydrolase family protein [Microbacteriaceae bacterium]|nr:fumarylacetoacetate hydrolase family protein [Microbacteriaceae bacterium]